MYWRLLAGILLLVVCSYLLGKRPHTDATARSHANEASLSHEPIAAAEPDETSAPDASSAANEEIVFPPSTGSLPTEAIAPPVENKDLPRERYTLDVSAEISRLASVAGVEISSIQPSSQLPSSTIMAILWQRGHCMLFINAAFQMEGTSIVNLSAYGKRQLTFTLGHETGHCYVRSHVARRDPAILPALSPPGTSYGFEQFLQMSTRYSEYPDLNRWNEEWADAFAVYLLTKTYGRDFAANVTQERYSLRKDQERNGSVLMSNVYGGHGVLAEDALYTIQSPMEIANLVKRGRLNTSR